MSRLSDPALPELPSWATAKLPNGRMAHIVAQGRGLPLTVLAARLQAGWSVERAVYERAPRVRRSPKVPRPSLLHEVRLANGKLAWPVAAAAGISEVTFRARLSRGLSPDEAASVPVASPSDAAAVRWNRSRKAKATSEGIPDPRSGPPTARTQVGKGSPPGD